MSAGDVAAIVISVSIGIAVVGLLFTMGAAIRACAVFRRSVEDLTSQTLPLIADMHAGIKQANADLMKLDTVLETAESISSTVDSASRMAYGAMANPLVKAMSTSAGVLRAFRGFRAGRAARTRRRG
jgi:hypothetical protein